MAASAIPATEAVRLQPSVRRTTAIRAALALALLAILAWAFLIARGYDPRHAPLVPAGSTGMVVIDLSASVYEGAMEETLQKLARTGEQAGLVVFSDVGYELLPPGTPGRELLPVIRYLKPVGAGGELPVNPWQDFRAGTRISAGLQTAREALQREGARRGSVVLISDLDILPDEVQRLAAEIAELKRIGIEVRIVPLDPTPEKTARIEALTSPSAFLRAPGRGEVRAPEEHSLREALPWTFVFPAALLVGLLALNERLLGRLELRR
jgi:hypothetical protein